MMAGQPGTGPGADPTPTLDAAIELYSQGRMADALRHTEAVLAHQPANAAALNVAGAIARAMGDAGAAEAHWRRAIATAPRFGEAYNNLGTLLHDLGRPAEAESCLRAALAINPGNSAAHYNMARVDVSLGRVDAAEAGFRRAIELQPGYTDAWTSLGLMLLDSSRGPEAVTSLARAAELAPHHSDTHFNLANVLLGLGRLEEAIAAYRRALGLMPSHLGALINLAAAERQRGHLPEAETALRRAMALAPEMAQIHWTLGAILHAQGRLTEAEAACRRALALAPDDGEAAANLGAILRDLGRRDEAEAVLQCAATSDGGHARGLTNLGALHLDGGRAAEALSALSRAVELSPGSADAHFNLGNALKTLGRLDDAAAAFEGALARAPDHLRALNNLGIVRRELKQHDNAERVFRRALSIDPGFVDARWNLGLTLLALGRLAEGWDYYEARADLPPDARPFTRPDVAFPPWRGEPLAGKSILVLREQGIGDEIQCARFVPLFRRLGARKVTLASRPALSRLFSTLGADRILVDDQSLVVDPHDYWTFSFSAARYLCPSIEAIPAELPYLRAAPDMIEKFRPLLATSGLRVGLVWKGGSLHANDRHRSLPGFETLRPLWRVPGVAFHALQKGRDETTPAPPDMPIIPLGTALMDFADTAAVVMQLDLVITVDTAVAHLAGALGRPCWVLLPAHDTDWRWLTDRDSSPWYPRVMRLFRQTRPGDWAAVVARVADQLRQAATTSA